MFDEVKDMNINTVMEIIQHYEAVLAYGKGGGERKVQYIEVMEVPHVDQWDVANTLILTSFYALREEEEAQVDIIQSFIEKEASGLIIKLGRFINQLPEKAIELAEKHNFPIIVIPKNTPYIDILTPLYHRLHISTDVMLIDQIEGRSYEDVDTILQDIYKAFGLVAYIESVNGELLFCCNQVKADKWRKDYTLFSPPSGELSKRYLKKIREEFVSYEKYAHLYSKDLNRMVVALFSKGKKYGLLHIVYTRKQQEKMLQNESFFRIVDKIHITIMSEIVSLQDPKEVHEFSLAQFNQEKAEKVLIHLHAANMPPMKQDNSILDPTLIMFTHIEKVLKKMETVHNYSFLTYNDEYFMLINLSDTRTSTFESEWRTYMESSLLQDIQLGVSYPFEDCTNLKGKLPVVSAIIRLGEQVKGKNQVYLQSQLGIQSVMLNFTKDKYVIDFVQNSLKQIHLLEEDLINTLKIYLAENCNATNTAKTMYLNRRTVTYRLKK